MSIVSVSDQFDLVEGDTMLLWEFLLRADRQEDLTGEQAAREWLARFVPSRVEGGRREVIGWCDEAQRRFARIVNALRSLAKRLKKGWRGRPSSFGDWEADHLLREYVNRGLRLTVKKKSLANSEPLHRKNLDGIGVVAVMPEGIAAEIATLGLSPNEQSTLKAIEELATSALGSLVVDQIVPVCSTCGRSLHPSKKTGRRSRARFCKTCIQQRWFDDKPDELKRKVWKLAKAKQRANKRKLNTAQR